MYNILSIGWQGQRVCDALFHITPTSEWNGNLRFRDCPEFGLSERSFPSWAHQSIYYRIKLYFERSLPQLTNMNHIN
jgi:hypothetical protein